MTTGLKTRKNKTRKNKTRKNKTRKNKTRQNNKLRIRGGILANRYENFETLKGTMKENKSETFKVLIDDYENYYIEIGKITFSLNDIKELDEDEKKTNKDIGSKIVRTVTRNKYNNEEIPISDDVQLRIETQSRWFKLYDVANKRYVDAPVYLERTTAQQILSGISNFGRSTTPASTSLVSV
jgi:hypothetical protein